MFNRSIRSSRQRSHQTIRRTRSFTRPINSRTHHSRHVSRQTFRRLPRRILQRNTRYRGDDDVNIIVTKYFFKSEDTRRNTNAEIPIRPLRLKRNDVGIVPTLITDVFRIDLKGNRHIFVHKKDFTFEPEQTGGGNVDEYTYLNDKLFPSNV